METGITRRNFPSPFLLKCLNVLSERAPKLREQGILHAGIFGSVARGEDDLKSDVDVLIHVNELDMGFSVTRMVGLRRELSTAFGRSVDIVSKDALKFPKHDRIVAEMVQAF